MGEKIKFTTEDETINFHISDSFSDLKEYEEIFSNRKVYTFIDSNISAEMSSEYSSTMNSISLETHTFSITIPETEKTMATLDEVFSMLLASKVDRNSIVVAMGGGVIGNLVGLASGLLFRGIQLVHIPTTLLSASDSTPSLKQAINYGAYKNTIGMYRTPSLVYINHNVFDTLPRLQILSAFGEFAKNALAVDATQLNYLKNIFDNGTLSDLDYQKLVADCISVKQSVMRNDKFEKKEAIILEYGHTVGHAMEILSNGHIHHGIAITLGMVIAGEVSHLLGYLDGFSYIRHQNFLWSFPYDFSLFLKHVNKEVLLEQVAKDNKVGYLNSQKDTIPMVLLSDIAQPIFTHGQAIHPVKLDVVNQAINNIWAKLREIENKNSEINTQKFYTES